MRLPDDTQRHAIFGMTGSGKTQFGLWALSRRSYDKMPWIIIDYKGDAAISRIPGLEEIDVTRKPPKHKGLYVVRPLPDVHDEALDDFMWKIWARGKTGIFLDEGYMIGRFNKAYRAILTQGRSKHIPVITLSQRPAWISPFICSESEFITAFYLHTDADVKRVREWMPGADPLALPAFHSWYWEVKSRQLTLLRPVPDEAVILDRFAARKPRRHLF